MVTGGCVGVVMEDSHFVPPLLLCWWWMMVMVQDAVMQWRTYEFYASLSVCGWWRTYNCFTPHCNDRLMIVFHCPLLLCRWFIKGLCHRAFLLLLVLGPLWFCAWSLSTSATKVNFSWQKLQKLLGSNFKHGACFFGHATVEEFSFESQPNGCSKKPGGPESWFFH